MVLGAAVYSDGRFINHAEQAAHAGANCAQCRGDCDPQVRTANATDSGPQVGNSIAEEAIIDTGDEGVHSAPTDVSRRTGS